MAQATIHYSDTAGNRISQIVEYADQNSGGGLTKEEAQEIKGKLTPEQKTGLIGIEAEGSHSVTGSTLDRFVSSRPPSPPSGAPGLSGASAARFQGTASAVIDGMTVTARYNTTTLTITDADKRAAERALRREIQQQRRGTGSLHGKTVPAKVAMTVIEDPPVGADTANPTADPPQVTATVNNVSTAPLPPPTPRTPAEPAPPPAEEDAPTGEVWRTATVGTGRGQKTVRFQDIDDGSTFSRQDAQNLVTAVENAYLPASRPEPNTSVNIPGITLPTGAQISNLGDLRTYAGQGPEGTPVPTENGEGGETDLSASDPPMPLDARLVKIRRMMDAIEPLLDLLIAAIMGGNWNMVRQYAIMMAHKTGLSEAEIATIMVSAMERLDIGDQETREELAQIVRGERNEPSDRARMIELQNQLARNNNLRELFMNNLRESVNRKEAADNFADSLLTAGGREARYYAWG